jgi:hypothetical protein
MYISWVIRSPSSNVECQSLRVVSHHIRFLVTGIYRQALAGDLSPVHVHHECTKTEMLKSEGVRIDGAEKVCLLK